MDVYTCTYSATCTRTYIIHIAARHSYAPVFVIYYACCATTVTVPAFAAFSLLLLLLLQLQLLFRLHLSLEIPLCIEWPSNWLEVQPSSLVPLLTLCLTHVNTLTSGVENPRFKSQFSTHFVQWFLYACAFFVFLTCSLTPALLGVAARKIYSVELLAVHRLKFMLCAKVSNWFEYIGVSGKRNVAQNTSLGVLRTRSLCLSLSFCLRVLVYTEYFIKFINSFYSKHTGRGTLH